MSDLLYTSRREFLTGSLRMLSVAATMPVFLGHTARALAAPQGRQKRRDDASKIFVVVQLSGGNDGLNTVIPYGHDLYYKYRRTLAIPKKDVLPLADGIGLHPAAEGLKALYDAGQLAIVQGVGYPNPNRSHFVSMDIWHTADPEQRKSDGWLGRYVDACCGGSDPGPSPVEGVALMQESPLALQGERFVPLAFSSVDDLTWRTGRRDARAAAAFERLNKSTGVTTQPTSETHEFLERAALEALVGAEQIRAAAGSKSGSLRERRGGGRGNSLAPQLDLVGRMIRADLPTRIYYVSLGGFDTHTGQLNRQQQLLKQLGDALADFLEDLREDGLLERVLVLAFSEFGRRVQENASGGTDHGEAAPLFLAGGAVRAGLHEPHPSLENLNRGDLAHGVDFRKVYATILTRWLDLPPRDTGKVLGSGFGMMNVLKA